jgi:hypothetical protein
VLLHSSAEHGLSGPSGADEAEIKDKKKTIRQMNKNK